VLKFIWSFIKMPEHPNAEMLAPDFSKRSCWFFMMKSSCFPT